MKTRFFSALLSAVLIAAASMGVTASAEETSISADEVQTETVTTAVNETEDSSVSAESGVYTDEITDIVSELAETTVTVPDYYGDPYYDTDGNASLIKSEQIIYNTEEMQFIAVTTKDGHVFYVLINYSAASGEDSVYFLNKVDDYDLYALLYAGEDDEDGNAPFTPEEAAQAAEEANGRVKPKTDSDKADTAETSENAEDGSEGEEQQQSVPMNMNSVYLLIGVVALIGVGAAAFMLTKKKSGNKTAVVNEPDDEEEEEVYIKEETEDFNFYDDNQDE